MACILVLIYLIVLNLGHNKNKLHKTLDYWSKDMFNFDFFKKSLGKFSLPHFVYDISRKMFPMPYSLNWPSSIVWLTLLLDILGNKCIVFVRVRISKTKPIRKNCLHSMEQGPAQVNDFFLHLKIILWKKRVLTKFCELIWLSFAN